MQPDITGIADGNHEITGERYRELRERVDALHIECCESLRILRAMQSLLEEFRPLINAYRQTGGGSMGLMKARKALRSGG